MASRAVMLAVNRQMVNRNYLLNAVRNNNGSARCIIACIRGLLLKPASAGRGARYNDDKNKVPVDQVSARQIEANTAGNS